MVIDVYKDTSESHLAFIGKIDLMVRLMADASIEVSEAYRIWQEN